MTDDNGNGKVTIAILGYRMDAMDRKLTELIEKMDRFIECSNLHENAITRQSEQIRTNHEEIEKLRSTSKGWDILTGIGTLIAGILGAIGINK
jgi:hypothetical protein